MGLVATYFRRIIPIIGGSFSRVINGVSEEGELKTDLSCDSLTPILMMFSLICCRRGEVFTVGSRYRMASTAESSSSSMERERRA